MWEWEKKILNEEGDKGTLLFKGYVVDSASPKEFCNLKNQWILNYIKNLTSQTFTWAYLHKSLKYMILKAFQSHSAFEVL